MNLRVTVTFMMHAMETDWAKKHGTAIEGRRHREAQHAAYVCGSFL
jgi:hypothetical protein